MTLALMLLALYGFVRWLQQDSRISYAGMIVCAALALLMMPPLIIFVVPALVLHKHLTCKPFWRNPLLWTAGGLALLPSCFWFSWAKYQINAFSLNSHGREDFRNWSSLHYYFLWWKHDLFSTMWGVLWDYTLGPILSILSACGLLTSSDTTRFVPLLWVLATILYFIIDIHPIAISIHYVYYLLLLPPLSWSAGRFTTCLWNTLKQPALIPVLALRVMLVCLMTFATLFHWDHHLRDREKWYRVKEHWLSAIQVVQLHVPQNARVVVDIFDPSFLYYANRQGLAKNPVDFNLENVQYWEKHGMTHALILHQEELAKNPEMVSYLQSRAKRILQTPEVLIYFFQQ